MSQSLVSETVYLYAYHWLHRYMICGGRYNTITSSFILSVAGTPTGVTASRTGYTTILVSWTDPSPPLPAGYEVFYQTSAGDSSRLSGGNTSNTELTLSGLTLGEMYYIFVVAFGKEGAPVLPSNRSNTAMIMLCEPMHEINM